MTGYKRMVTCIFCVLITGICLCSCSKPPVKADPASLVVSNVEYSIRQTHKSSFVVDAKGKIKNTGKLAVKNVVVTGYCRSCGLQMLSNKWFTSDVEKTETQKDTINYLAPGAETEFSFVEVACYMTQENMPPKNLPEKIEIKIESFDTVQGS